MTGVEHAEPGQDGPHSATPESGSAVSLAVKDVAFSYDGSETVLSDVSFKLAHGDFVAVLGGSGSGKSTLLRLLGGLLVPTAGSVSIDGKEVRKPTPDVGFVFQAARLLPWKTVLENVLVPTRAFGDTTHKQINRAEELLGSVGLTKAIHSYPTELSGGMAQRVGLARMLMHDPRLLLMDEPFAALDALTREFLSDELQALWLREKKTVVFVTHSIQEAVFLADRVIVLGGKPATIMEVVDIPLPRPRTLDDMATAEFNTLVHSLRQMLASRFVSMPGLV